MGKISFMKISATGNDFILIDNRAGKFEAARDSGLLAKLCQRRISVGADGVILLQKCKKADFKYTHINPDGSIAEMCGNGTRAVSYFANRIGVASASLSFEINNNIYKAKVKDTLVTTDFIPPVERDMQMKLTEEAELEDGGYIDTGVPHFVIFVKDIRKVNVFKLGQKYRHMPVFPRGANIDFVQVVDRKHLFVRTFERGVEAETFACGTGAVASALISHLKKNTQSPTEIAFPGGNLTIAFDKYLKRVKLIGTVTPVYHGVVLSEIDLK